MVICAFFFTCAQALILTVVLDRSKLLFITTLLVDVILTSHDSALSAANAAKYQLSAPETNFDIDFFDKSGEGFSHFNFFFRQKVSEQFGNIFCLGIFSVISMTIASSASWICST